MCHRVDEFAPSSVLRTTSFIHFVVIKECLNIRPVSEPAPGLVIVQFLAHSVGFITPAALAQERIPNKDLLFARFSSFVEAPCEDFFVGALLSDALAQRGVIHTEKPNAATIKTFAQVFVVVR